MNTELRCVDEAIGHWLPQYEFGLLSDAEQASFEQHMMDCDFCAVELRSMQTVVATMQHNRRELLAELARQGLSYTQLRAELLSAAGVAERQRVVPVKAGWLERLVAWWTRPQVWVPAVGMAVIIFAIGIYVREPSNPYRPLLQYEVLPFSGVILRSGAEAEREFQLGSQAYQTRAYSEAVSHFRRASELDPQNGDAWLYLGVSQYVLKDAGAVASLQTAESVVGGDPERLPHVRWYLAQAYLYAGDVKQAQLQLDWLIVKGGAHAAEARALTEKVRAK